jgi:hypothetical protein
MKKIFILLAFVFTGATLFAQAPDKMSYQAVIRNASNNLVTSSPVGMRISILQGSASGPVAYVETQTPTTNANGLASIEIGSGVVISGTFASIDWSGGPYFIKTETDPLGGTTYTITGTSQLLSVPYAIYARTASNVPTNVSALVNDAGYISSEVDGSTTNELQTISRTGLVVTLSNGGGSYTDSVNVYTAGTGINIAGNVISSTTNNIGDVKHGYQSGDHNGWYLLDGRLLTLLPGIAQTNAATLGITVNLPNAINRFLADIGAVGTTGGASTVTVAQANLPNVNFTGTAALGGSHSHTVDPASTSTSSNGAHQHDVTSTANDLNNASSQGWPAGGHNGFRTTDRLELTIVAAQNLIHSAGAHTHTVDIASTASSVDPGHTHTVTVSSGGSGTAINITNPYLSVNTFIYLGQ